MRRAQVVVCEWDGLLAGLLRSRAAEQGWWLREVRHADAALGALGPGGGDGLVLRVGRDVERELALLERVGWLYPDTRAVVVGDAENAPLADLAWDLGASLVLLPPLPRAHLPEAVAGLIGPPPQGGPAAP